MKFFNPDRRKNIWPAIGFLAGVVLSIFLFYYVRDDIEREARTQFERQSIDARHIIDRRLQSYVGVADGLRALFSSKRNVGRAEFHNYVKALNLEKNYPGFISVNYARQVTAAEKNRFEAEVRRDKSINREGYSNFQILPPGDRPDYHVLVYLEPMAGQESVFGRDISIGDARRRAQDRARDTGELSSSGRLVQFPGENSFVALSMRIVTYEPGASLGTVEQRRAAFSGSVGAGYHVGNLMSGVLDNTAMTYMRFRFYDAGLIDASENESNLTLLYDSAQKGIGIPKDDFQVADAEEVFEMASKIQLAGRNWEIRFSAPKSVFMKKFDQIIPWLVLSAGLIVNALVFAVLYSFSSSRERAEAIAKEITKELRESEANLSLSLDQQRLSAVQIRDLLHRLVTVQEAERRTISANLHDVVGQNLSVLGMGIETLRGMLPMATAKMAAPTFNEITQLLREIMASVRTAIADLRPPLLDDYGLYAAIESHARQIEARTGLRVTVEGAALQPRPTREVELALFRIAQEALVNVAKHAEASEARISISGGATLARLTVEDNGSGAPRLRAANDSHGGGWGMAVMRERAAAVGGAMRVEHPERGMRIVVEVVGDQHRSA